MKHLFVFIGVFLSAVAYSQNCETLEKENQLLKSKLASLIDTTQNARIKSFDPNFKIEVSSVIGNKDQQTIDVVFVISHNKVHQEVRISLGDLRAYDDQGNVYDISQARIGMKQQQNSGSGYIMEEVPTSVPVKSTVTVRRVLPSVETLKKMIITITYRDTGGSFNFSKLEFDNLKITWK